MTTARRHALQLDDPLAPTQPAARDEPPAQPSEHTSPKPTRDQTVDSASSARRTGTAPAKPRAARTRQPQPLAQTTPGDQEKRDVWRTWSGVTGVGSFRLPHELVIELSETARELGLPIGMIVTAAITQLLDQPPERIAELVDRADDARIDGRRHARRRLTARTEP
jgi:hypothetical protein